MTTRRRCSARAGRAKLHSPGRPSVRRHEEQRRFWVAIAAGRPSEDAAADAGVSPAVGTRWFREAGGMAASHLRPSAPPPSGRYLAFTDREQIALWRAQGHGVRAIGRQLARAPSTISRELRRNAATRSGGLEYRATTAQWHADRAARRPKPAKLAVNANLQQYVQERLEGVVIDRAKRHNGSQACRAVDGASARAATASAVGPGVEPRADCPAPPARLPRRCINAH